MWPGWRAWRAHRRTVRSSKPILRLGMWNMRWRHSLHLSQGVLCSVDRILLRGLVRKWEWLRERRVGSVCKSRISVGQVLAVEFFHSTWNSRRSLASCAAWPQLRGGDGRDLRDATLRIIMSLKNVKRRTKLVRSGVVIEPFQVFMQRRT